MSEVRVLAAVLSEFARTMVTDFPIQSILDRLVERIVDVLPVTSAGVTLIGAGHDPHYIAASDAAALRFEQLQSELGQGPCLRAYSTGVPVQVPDLAVDTVFPVFSPAAADAGCAAVFTFPLRHGAGCLGALDLYRDSTGPLGAEDTAAAQTLADVTAAYLLNARARDDAATALAHHQHTAMHDALTGLPNRRLLLERLDHAAARAQRSHTTAAVLFCDLDRFKAVNDTYGHQAGDELLLAVAHRLSGLIRPGDTLARVSGDEFVFLCEDLGGVTDVHRVAARVVGAFGHPFVLAGATLVMSASVGVAYAGPGEELSEELLHRADATMYEVKRRGGGTHQVGGGDPTGTTQTVELASAVVAGQIVPYYQPVVDLRTGAVVGLEALARWHHPTRGVLGPAAFLGVAEDTDLITDLDLAVLAQATHDLSGWLPDHPGLRVNVNLSGRHFDHPDCVERIIAATTRGGVAASSVTLEVTETVALTTSSDHPTAALGRLRALGYRVLLDDFGTGFSAVEHVLRLPIDGIKLDRTVAHALGTRVGDAVTRALVGLSTELGLTTVIEGIETPRQVEAARSLGCTHAQGFHWSAAVPAHEVPAHLTAIHPSPQGPIVVNPAA